MAETEKMMNPSGACWEKAETLRQEFLAGRSSGGDGEEARYLALRQLAEDPALRDCPVGEAPSEAAYWWLVTARQAGPEEFLARFFSTVTVSMTSFPARIHLVADSLKSVFSQSRKPDRVLLWLAEEQFPGREADVPEALRALSAEGRITIRWCDDLKPHKKYFYALQEIEEGVIVTLDDDLLYPEDTVELLLLSYVRHPKAVSACRVNLMTLEEGGEAFLPYSRWIKETDALVDTPDLSLLATTGAGTLYPAGLLSGRVFDKARLLKVCPLADDLWLKCHEIAAGIPVTLCCYARKLTMTDGSQGTTLWQQNRSSNDSQLRETLQSLEPLKGGQSFAELLRQGSVPGQPDLEGYSLHASRQIDKKNEAIRRLHLEYEREIRRLQGEHREEINRLKEAIAEKNEALHANQEEIHRTKEAIAEKNEALRANQEEIHRAKEAIAEKNEALKELQRQKKELKESETRLKEKIAHNTETIMQLNADIEALKNSTSYRIGQKILSPVQMLKKQ